MLRLGDFCNSQELCPPGYGSMGCDDSNECYFGGSDDEWSVWVPDNEWLIWVPDIDRISLGSTMDSPLKT